MSRFNTQTSHPLIPNSQDYLFEQQYISVHSEDRNIVKYPNASEFEIELPQDYLNVQGFRLVSGYFPAKVNTFSREKKNVTMTFMFETIYNPSDHGVVDPIEVAIYNTLVNYTDNYVVIIDSGTYDTEQMTNEVQNKMNQVVTDLLLGDTSTLTDVQKDTYLAAGGYLDFVTAFNEVSRKLWIGNRKSSFILTNTDTARYEEETSVCLCEGNDNVPTFKHWGLPGFLGFRRCNVESSVLTDPKDARFYYRSQGNYDWLIASSLAGAQAHYLTAPLQMNVNPNNYIYMEIKLLNSIDETAPYNYSKFTQETNQTNGVVKSAFAKIPLNNDTLGSYYEEYVNANYFKLFNPPVERIRKLSIKFRFHDGMLVDFNNQDYSFTLEMTMLRPQNNRAYNLRIPASIANNV